MGKKHRTPDASEPLDPTSAEADEAASFSEPPDIEDEGFSNPLGGGGQTVDAQFDEPADPTAAAQGTAALGSKLVSMGCAMRWNYPLTDAEDAQLQRDLAAVLVKYDAPALPYAEEVQLTATMGGIIFTRAAHEKASQAQRAAHHQQEAASDDSSRDWQEGLRQNGSAEENSGARPSSEARDLLS